MSDDIGAKFQKDTEYSLKIIQSGTAINWSQKPELYKYYSGANQIRLPDVKQLDTAPLHKILETRKSIRKYSGKPVSIEKISYLLWASNGINRREENYQFRTAPSAGALYPIEIYILANNVDEIKPGIYHYAVREHILEEIAPGSFREQFETAALGQNFCITSAAVFIFSAIFERAKWKYKERAYRYIYLDAGHIAQNLAITCTGIGLGSCQVGAFLDNEMNEIIGVDGLSESVIYLTTIGYPK